MFHSLSLLVCFLKNHYHSILDKYIDALSQQISWYTYADCCSNTVAVNTTALSPHQLVLSGIQQKLISRILKCSVANIRSAECTPCLSWVFHLREPVKPADPLALFPAIQHNPNRIFFIDISLCDCVVCIVSSSSSCLYGRLRQNTKPRYTYFNLHLICCLLT